MSNKPNSEVSEVVPGEGPPKSATKAKRTKPKKSVPKTGKLTSLDIFELCIERSENLITIHAEAHGAATRPPAHLSDAFRASVVLSVSALDAFVRSHLLERIASILRDKNKPLPPTLSTEIRRLIKDEELLESARKDDLVQRVEKAFTAEFEKKSFQGVKNISDAMKLLGDNDVFHTISMKAGKNEDNLKKEITEFTQRRHCIAHQGDYDVGANPAEPKSILKSDAEKCIKLVKLVAKHLKEI